PRGMTTVRETRRPSMTNPPYGPSLPPGAGVPLAEGPRAEVPLVGDGVTRGIVRIGDTVRRPTRPMTATVQAYLRHLHARGFTGAPLPLGTDEHGREMLSFVPGDVPMEPLPPQCAQEEVLRCLARLIRQLHDAAEGWEPPAGAIWGSLPGTPVPLPAAPELVGHADYCPGNVVFRDGLPAALIDFVLARPTTRLAEVGNALRYWVPLRDPEDRSPAWRDLDAALRIGVFAHAYALDRARREQLVPLLIERARASLAWAETAAAADPVFHRFWTEDWCRTMPRAVAWLEREAPAIERVLLP
ncbi:MAG: phosphotransferase enzyme family protein, partial [Candidatus Dormibacteria bacterium]